MFILMSLRLGLYADWYGFDSFFCLNEPAELIYYFIDYFRYGIKFRNWSVVLPVALMISSLDYGGLFFINAYRYYEILSARLGKSRILDKWTMFVMGTFTAMGISSTSILGNTSIW